MTSPRGRNHGLVVRPYILTGGRTEPSHRELALETVVTTVSGTDAARMLDHEEAAIVRLCEAYQSVAEIAAHLGIPLGVARVNPRGFTRSEVFSGRTRGSVGAWTGG